MDLCRQIKSITFDDKNEFLNVGDRQDVEVEKTLDSGACMYVMPRDCAPGHQVRDSVASRRGLNFTVGTVESCPTRASSR